LIYKINKILDDSIYPCLSYQLIFILYVLKSLIYKKKKVIRKKYRKSTVCLDSDPLT